MEKSSGEQKNVQTYSCIGCKEASKNASMSNKCIERRNTTLKCENFAMPARSHAGEFDTSYRASPVTDLDDRTRNTAEPGGGLGPHAVLNYGMTSSCDKTLISKSSASQSRCSTPFKDDINQEVKSSKVSAALCNCPVSETHQALLHSESRRHLLLQKLKDAQDLIRIQAQKVAEVEILLHEKENQIGKMLLAEKDSQRMLRNLETELTASQEKHKEQQFNIEGNHHRMEQMRSEIGVLKATNALLEEDCKKKAEQLDKNSIEIISLKEECNKLTQLTDRLTVDIGTACTADEWSRTKAEQLEHQAKKMRLSANEIKSELERVCGQNKQLRKQLSAASSQLESIQIAHNALGSELQHRKLEKDQVLRQLANLQDTCSDLKTTLSRTAEEKKACFQEKLELHQKLQNSLHTCDALSKDRLSLSSQLAELSDELTRANSRTIAIADEKRILSDELAAAKKVSEALTSELTTMKSRLEHQMELVRSIEQVREETFQQCHEYEQDITRLNSELRSLQLTNRQLEDARNVDLKTLRAEAETWKSRYEKTKCSLDQKEAAVNSLNSAINQMQNEKYALEREQAVAKQQFTEEMEKHLKRIGVLESQNEEHLTSIAKLTNDLKSLQKTVEAFQLIHEEDARIMMELKKTKSSSAAENKPPPGNSADDSQRASNDGATFLALHREIAHLKSKLEAAQQKLSKQEALIFALRRKSSGDSHSEQFNDDTSSTARSAVDENDIDQLRRENQELNRKVAVMTRALQMKNVGQEQYAWDVCSDQQRQQQQQQLEKNEEKFRRELIARDRQIESLEEQLARYTDMSLRCARRESSRVELLSSENRRLQNQLDDCVGQRKMLIPTTSSEQQQQQVTPSATGPNAASGRLTLPRFLTSSVSSSELDPFPDSPLCPSTSSSEVCHTADHAAPEPARSEISVPVELSEKHICRDSEKRPGEIVLFFPDERFCTTSKDKELLPASLNTCDGVLVDVSPDVGILKTPTAADSLGTNVSCTVSRDLDTFVATADRKPIISSSVTIPVSDSKNGSHAAQCTTQRGTLPPSNALTFTKPDDNVPVEFGFTHAVAVADLSPESIEHCQTNCSSLPADAPSESISSSENVPLSGNTLNLHATDRRPAVSVRVANDDDYSVCTEDDDEFFPCTKYAVFPTSSSLAYELAAAELGLETGRNRSDSSDSRHQRRRAAADGSRRNSQSSSVADINAVTDLMLFDIDFSDRNNNGLGATSDGHLVMSRFHAVAGDIGAPVVAATTVEGDCNTGVVADLNDLCSVTERATARDQTTADSVCQQAGHQSKAFSRYPWQTASADNDTKQF